MFENRDIGNAISSSYSDGIRKLPNGSWCKSPSSDPRDRRHTWVIPARYVAFLHQLRAHQLPVSERTIASVKDILIQEETPDYVLRGKPGWAVATEPHLG